MDLLGRAFNASAERQEGSDGRQRWRSAFAEIAAGAWVILRLGQFHTQRVIGPKRSSPSFHLVHPKPVVSIPIKRASEGGKGAVTCKSNRSAVSHRHSAWIAGENDHEIREKCQAQSEEPMC
jgi:hypothetical protein